MGRTFIVVLLLTLFLAALFFATTNVGSANAQPFQPIQTEPSEVYLVGATVGRALGVKDGAAIGAQHDVAGYAYSAESSYTFPSPTHVCTVYQDFFAAEGFLCVNSQHYLDFSNGYMEGYAFGYTDGYFAGYYLATTLGSLLSAPQSIQ